MNRLEQLRNMTTVVADTGDIESIKEYKPIDATTNPSLLLNAATMPQYNELVKEAIGFGQRNTNSPNEQINLILDKISVNFGVEILKIVPGRISTEVDSRLSFNTDETIKRAQHIMSLYADKDIGPERILIKIASTWEGIQAAQQLEKEGIHCNLTLLFSLAQAIACAEAGVTLISPFVGRILDWYKQAEGVDSYPASEDPGVLSVSAIYDYFKKFDYKTSVMGASFRNIDEILALAGCDLLTISPKLMAELQNSDDHVTKNLNPEDSTSMDIDKITINESIFRWMMNEDAMASEKLSEGIRNFTVDTLKLQQYVTQLAQHAAA